MRYLKKSLGQNFLIDKNIIKKIIGLTNLKERNIVEIGPGEGALTNEIIKKNPKSLTLIEKDNKLSKYLKQKYFNKEISVINTDILKFDFDKLNKKNMIVIGNLPYNISSQILIKIIKTANFETKFSELIFMFQKELGEKIIANFPSKHYGRLSIITKFKLHIIKKFIVSKNCFFPKPKVTSMVVHFKTLDKKKSEIKNISNLEKITNIFFSNKRKMINKKIKEILSIKKMKEVPELDLSLRPEKVNPKIFYKITMLYEKN